MSIKPIAYNTATLDSLLSIFFLKYSLSAGFELLKPCDQDLMRCLCYLSLNNSNREGDSSENMLEKGYINGLKRVFKSASLASQTG